MYSPNFTVENKTFCLSLHYNGDYSYLFAIKFKAKDSEIKPYPLCLGNISKDFSKKLTNETGLHGYIYDFSLDYWKITKDKILNIHKHLMEKNGI